MAALRHSSSYRLPAALVRHDLRGQRPAGHRRRAVLHTKSLILLQEFVDWLRRVARSGFTASMPGMTEGRGLKKQNEFRKSLLLEPTVCECTGSIPTRTRLRFWRMRTSLMLSLIHI